MTFWNFLSSLSLFSGREERVNTMGKDNITSRMFIVASVAVFTAAVEKKTTNNHVLKVTFAKNRPWNFLLGCSVEMTSSFKGEHWSNFTAAWGRVLDSNDNGQKIYSNWAETRLNKSLKRFNYQTGLYWCGEIFINDYLKIWGFVLFFSYRDYPALFGVKITLSPRLKVAVMAAVSLTLGSKIFFSLHSVSVFLVSFQTREKKKIQEAD